MKQLLFILLIASTINTIGQNILSNPGFEDYVNCPQEFSRVSSAIGWKRFGKGTPDYFNKCSDNKFISVPANSFGYQEPYSGNAYCGIIVDAGSRGNKEYLSRSFPALKAGHAYEVSMSVSLAEISGSTINNMGIFFFINPPPDTGKIVGVKPQVHYAPYGFISNKQDWVRLIDTFIADSAYTHIIIGSFADSASTHTMYVTDSLKHSEYKFSYIYIDSVAVRQLGKASEYGHPTYLKPPKSENRGYYMH